MTKLKDKLQETLFDMVLYVIGYHNEYYDEYLYDYSHKSFTEVRAFSKTTLKQYYPKIIGININEYIKYYLNK
jgi:hypothetical protein